MRNNILRSMIAAAMLACAALPLAGQTSSAASQEAKWIEVLKSDDSIRAKAEACRQLALIGTENAVAPLAALLADAQLNHMARYGLETIPSPAVDAAFRDALGKLKGKPLVGVIGSVGVRKDEKAVDALSALLSDADNDVAQAAARALGKIANSEAANALKNALPNVSKENQLAFCEGLFRCAEKMRTDKTLRKEALAIYQLLRKVDPAPHQVKAGALRGVIVMRQKAAIPLIKESLKNPDFVLFDAAVRATQEMRTPEIAAALAEELGSLPADRQIVVMQTLANKRDAATIPALSEIAKSGSGAVRQAALRAIIQMERPVALPLLQQLMEDKDKEIAQIATEGMASLPGAEADAAINELLNSSDTNKRLTGFDLVGRRRLASSMPALLKAAGESETKIRTTALKRLGELAGEPQLPAMLDLLAKFSSAADLNAMEQALTALCARLGKSEEISASLASRFGQASAAQKQVMIALFASMGGKNALKAVRDAAKNADVRSEAIRALGSWKTADAAPDLLDLAKNAANDTDRMLCLRGYLDLCANTDIPADQRLGMCKNAAQLIQRNEEKKLLLAALGGTQAPEAFEMILPHLENGDIKEEACVAIVAVAEAALRNKQLPSAQIQGVSAALTKVTEAKASTGITRKAGQLLKQAQKQAQSK